MSPAVLVSEGFQFAVPVNPSWCAHFINLWSPSAPRTRICLSGVTTTATFDVGALASGTGGDTVCVALSKATAPFVFLSHLCVPEPASVKDIAPPPELVESLKLSVVLFITW